MKKRLIITSALMTCLLGASLATGTYAWYQATAAATVTPSATNATVGTAASTLDEMSYKVSVTYSKTLDTVNLTDKNGDTWAVVGGYIKTANGSTLYGTPSTTGTDYTVSIMDSEGTALTGADLAAAKANLKAAGKTYNITATGSDHVRLTLTDPSTDFATAFGANIKNTITVGTLSFATGEPVVTIATGGYYFSVSGNDDNSVPTEDASATEWIPSGQTITYTLVEAA